MGRPAAITPDQIRTTVLAMLAEAGDPQPASGERFRRIVSVRKLRARLGAGDPTTLSRHLNAVEAELVQAGLGALALPDLPPPVAEQMRTLWQLAVSAQLDELSGLRREAEASVHASKAAQHDADVRSEMLRLELQDLRDRLAARDSELKTLYGDCRSLKDQTEALSSSARELKEQLTHTRAELVASRSRQAVDLAEISGRYEGLSRQLLQETEYQRRAFTTERERLAQDVQQAQERTAALEGLRERLLSDLASERNAHQQAAAQVRALEAAIDDQRRLLEVFARPAPHGRRARGVPETAEAVPPAGAGGTPGARRSRRGAKATR